MQEHWLDRAIEDKLGEIIDKYRAKGQDVHNVGALRQRVAADINALRGSSQWAALTARYDPKPTNTLAWCCVCDKPVTRNGVSAWLENKRGDVFCSIECQHDTAKHPISLNEFKRRMKEKGSMTTHRKEFDAGMIVEGEQITLTWDDVKDWGGPLREEPVSVVSDDGIDWSE